MIGHSWREFLWLTHSSPPHTLFLQIWTWDDDPEGDFLLHSSFHSSSQMMCCSTEHQTTQLLLKYPLWCTRCRIQSHYIWILKTPQSMCVNGLVPTGSREEVETSGGWVYWGCPSVTGRVSGNCGGLLVSSFDFLAPDMSWAACSYHEKCPCQTLKAKSHLITSKPMRQNKLFFFICYLSQIFCNNTTKLINMSSFSMSF